MAEEEQIKFYSSPVGKLQYNYMKPVLFVSLDIIIKAGMLSWHLLRSKTHKLYGHFLKIARMTNNIACFV